MRILFLPKLLPRSNIIGGPILIYHRIKNLSQMGHKISVLAPSYTEEDKKDKSLEKFCERVIKIDSKKEKSDSEIERLYKRLKRPKFFFTGDGGYDENIENALRKILREKQFDVIIAEYSMMGQYLESNRKFIPQDTLTVISVHECYTKAFELRRKKGENISGEVIEELRNYEFKMYKSVDKIFTLTKEDAYFLVEYSPELKEKIYVIPHGVDTDFYKPPKRRVWDRDTKNILYIGNFRHYPNVDAVKNFIFKVWEKVLKAVPDAKFYAIGFDPPDELLNLRNENIIIQPGGDNENVRRFYWNSDIFVAPIELGTGFRGKILEAMACGLPVVATKLATFGIEPEHGKHMFITDDYDEFAEYVIMLLKDKNLRKKISMNALALAREFDHKNAAKKLHKILKEAR